MKNIILLFVISTISLYGDGYGFLQQFDGTKSRVSATQIQNNESKENMEQWLKGGFSLEAYKVNYLLPYGYADKKYLSNGRPTHYKNIEAELQVSFKRQVASNLFNLHGSYYLAYSHKSFWQIYVYSSPFRETNYNPEGFVVFPIEDNHYTIKMRSLKFSIAHKSNGQPNTTHVMVDGKPMKNLSKSINYVYSTLRLQKETLLIDLTLWEPLGTGTNLSDNPDIMDYIGYGSVKLTYFYRKGIFTFMGRGNPWMHKGALEITYSYPLQNETNLYMKFFSGYEESLIDYNRNITKIAIGFSFSR